MVAGPYTWNQFSVMALLSAVLYGSLAITSGFYYRKLRCAYLENGGISAMKGPLNKSKLTFFMILCVSAMCDVPLFVGCLAEGGPLDCEWNTISYTLSWVLHLMALVGYAITMGIPLFLWSDIRHGRDGDLFSRKYPDFSKLFLHVSIAAYFILLTMTAMTILIVADNPRKYHTTTLRKVGTLAEPIVIFIIASVWLWNGIRLQMYVVDVRFRRADERKILFTINVVLFAILCSYLLRAVMVISLYTDYHTRTLHFLNYSYIVWVVCTRWIPYVFCSYLLIFLMRRSVTTVEAVSLPETETESFLQTAVPVQRKLARQKYSSPSVGQALANVTTNGRTMTCSDDFLPHAYPRQQLHSSENASSQSGSATSQYFSSSVPDDYDQQYRVHSCDAIGTDPEAGVMRRFDSVDSSGEYFGAGGNGRSALLDDQYILEPPVAAMSPTNSSAAIISSVRSPLLENSKDIASLIL
jgi:hypothetical protein